MSEARFLSVLMVPFLVHYLNDYVVEVAGNGNGGPPTTTGWQLFQVSLGTLSAGNHTLIVGGYNNKKTYNNESTEVLIDDVKLQ